MKISLPIAALFIFVFIVCPHSSAGETTENKSIAAEETQQAVIRVKTKQKVDFSGTVTHIDPAMAVLSIRSQGKTITFDMSRTILIGYQNVGEIKKGDGVSVGYTQSGLQIRKGIFAVTRRDTTSHREAAPQKSSVRAGAVKQQKGGLVWMKGSKDPKSFRDIDNNKDGKVTPIELCVLEPDLTLQKFREYDKNNDGCLNESEFNTVKISR